MDGYADETDAGCEDCTCSGTGYESKTLGGVTVYVDCNKDKCWTPTITKTWGPTGGAKASCIGAGSSYPACNYCDNLVYGGFTDWILPNKTDLKALCATTTVCPDPPNTCFGGDGVSGYYWSSTGYGADWASLVQFAHFCPYYNDVRTLTYSLRCKRP